MPATIVTLPARGNIDRIERFTSTRDGSDQIRVYSDDDSNRHEPPSLTEILAAAGHTLTVADGTVECEVIEDMDDGNSMLVRITGSQAVTDAVDAWMAGKTLDDVRASVADAQAVEIEDAMTTDGATRTAITAAQATARARTLAAPNRDGLVEVDMRGN